MMMMILKKRKQSCFFLKSEKYVKYVFSNSDIVTLHTFQISLNVYSKTCNRHHSLNLLAAETCHNAEAKIVIIIPLVGLAYVLHGKKNKNATQPTVW